MTYLICTQRRQSNKLKGSKKPMPNGEQITRHVAKIPRREFTTSLHPLPMLVKLPSTANTAAHCAARRPQPSYGGQPFQKIALYTRVCLDGPASMNYETRYVLHASLLTHSPHGFSHFGVGGGVGVAVVFTLKASFLVKKETILRIIDLSMKRAVALVGRLVSQSALALYFAWSLGISTFICMFIKGFDPPLSPYFCRL